MQTRYKTRCRTKCRTSRRRKSIRGGSILSFLKKANKWLRKTGAISKATGFLSKNTGLPYVSKISKYAKMAGYGRRQGGALRLAGGRRYRRR